MDKPSWKNTKLVKGDIAAEMRKVKEERGSPMVIMGSGSIVSQLAQSGLIDEFQMVVNPIVLGRGRTMFEGVRERLALKLVKTARFPTATWYFGTRRSGEIWLTFPAFGQLIAHLS